MLALLKNFFAGSFIPHGHCYLWKPELVWLHVASDSLIALAYYSIPVILVYFVQKRRDVPFNWIFLMFAAFIVCCGTTHLMEVWTLWHPTYWLSGLIKMMTAIVSLSTAFLLIPLMPKALALPSLEAVNKALQREIAERKQAEAQYRIMGEAIPYGVWMSGADGGTRYVSQSFRDLLDMTIEECQQFGWMKRLPPEDVEPTLEAWQHCVETGESWEWEHQILGADGEYRTILTRGRPVREETGQIASWVGINLDISDRKRMEHERVQLLEQIESKQRLLEAVLQQMPAGVVVTEAPNEGLVLMNDRVKQILGGDDSTVERMADYLLNYQIFYPNGEQYTPEDVPLARAMRRGEVVIEEEAEILRGNGTRCTILANAAPVRDSQGAIIAGVVAFYDITERKRMETERAQLLAQEQQIRELAEQTTERIARLQYVTAALSEALTASQVADAILTGGLAALGANEGVVSLLNEDGTEFENIRIVGYPQEVIDAWPGFSANARVPIADAVRNKQPIWLQTREERYACYREFDEIRKTITGNGALAAIPLSVNDRMVGGLGLGFPEDREFNQDDRGFMLALAHQCAQALERSRLFEAERVARGKAEEALKALQQSEARFRRLVESNVIGVLIGNFSGDITYANDAFLEMVGYSREQMEAGGLRWLDLTPPEYLPLDERSQAEMLTRGVCTQYEKEFFHYDGSRVPILIGSALLEGYEETAVCFAIDLSDRKRAEQERDRLLELERSARAEAEAANRIKDEFLAILSHELRTPLNPILGWAKLLQMRKFDDKAMTHALQTIERNAKLLCQLIEDLLDVSRILQGKLNLKVSPVQLSTLIEAAIETVRLAAEAKSIQIKTRFECEGVKVLGDPNRLQQVIWNLLSNAVKFTPQQGQVEISVNCRGDRAEIQVKDSGIGIKPEFLPHVFDYFRQADSTTTRTFGGLGLGLAIVRYLVELHGGTVTAESAGVDRGATFTVMLPLQDVLLQTNRENVSPEPNFLNLDGIRVLVVEDEADTRELVKLMLKKYGAEVRAVASATLALNALSEFKPDILVSDIGMPHMDGYQLIRHLRGLTADRSGEIPAIALTAYAAEADHLQILSAGFQQHLTKPVDPEALVAAIAYHVRWDSTDLESVET